MLESTQSHTHHQNPLDVRAWAIWLAVLLLVAFMTRNPWYQALIGLWIVLTWPPVQPQGLSLKGVLWFGAIAVTFGMLFNALTVHVGETVILTIPGDIPLLSGHVTLEAAAFGASNGLTIALIVLIFARFSAAIDYGSILRFLPAALFEMGLIVSISFTLLPNMRRAWRDIQQTQALRGHRVRGLRDLPPLIVPLVVSGLERALVLAEAMEARGYARQHDRSAHILSRLLLNISLLGILALVVLNTFWDMERLLFIGGLAFSSGCLIFGLRTGRHTRTHFRQGHWSWNESVVTAGIILILVAFLLAAPRDLNFSPYPRLEWPTFNPWLGIATIGVVLPGLLSHHD